MDWTTQTRFEEPYVWAVHLNPSRWEPSFFECFVGRGLPPLRQFVKLMFHHKNDEKEDRRYESTSCETTTATLRQGWSSKDTNYIRRQNKVLKLKSRMLMRVYPRLPMPNQLTKMRYQRTPQCLGFALPDVLFREVLIHYRSVCYVVKYNRTTNV